MESYITDEDWEIGWSYELDKLRHTAVYIHYEIYVFKTDEELNREIAEEEEKERMRNVNFSLPEIKKKIQPAIHYLMHMCLMHWMN